MGGSCLHLSVSETSVGCAMVLWGISETLKEVGAFDHWSMLTLGM